MAGLVPAISGGMLSQPMAGTGPAMTAGVDLQDPLPLAQALIRCASVTPADAGAQGVLSSALQHLGFIVTP